MCRYNGKILLLNLVVLAGFFEEEDKEDIRYVWTYKLLKVWVYFVIDSSCFIMRSAFSENEFYCHCHSTRNAGCQVFDSY